MFDDSFTDAWRKRFGAEAPVEAEQIAPFLRHRSVRHYTDEPISEGLLSALIACGQSAATSSNLQLWTVISIQDPERRAQIAKLCDDQKQIHTAACFLGFFADHHRLRVLAESVGEDPNGLPYNEFYTMAVVDATLAAERMVCAAEAIGLGTCYIGALRNDPYGVQELLSLPKGLFGVFGLCLGWPKQPLRAEIKPRLNQEVIWHRETYQPELDVSGYNQRMRDFYESQGMSGEFDWTMRSARRINKAQLTGRHVLKDYLAKQNMDVL